MELADILLRDDVVEECTMRSSFGFMAFHGGALSASGVA